MDNGYLTKEQSEQLKKWWEEFVTPRSVPLYTKYGTSLLDDRLWAKFENEESKMHECIVVNLFGAPGVGKSTGAAYIFSQLKLRGVNAELVTEFAKDKVWEENPEVFKPDNQCYLFAKQYYRMNRCKDEVEVIVTDSPLPLSIFYNKSEILGENFNQMVMDCFNSFNNLNYFLLRAKPYNPKGRLQTEEESMALQDPLMDLIYKRDIELKAAYQGITEKYDKIVEEVMKILEEKNV